MKDVVKLLIEKKRTISTMESCTGGGIANAITNIPDASMVIAYSAVTYSNDFKIKMGVAKEVIDKYTVYSMETARSMAKAITDYTNSSYGVGVTGKLKKYDKKNPYGADDVVYLAIFSTEKQKYYEEMIHLSYDNREQNKEEIIQTFVKLMKEILQND